MIGRLWQRMRARSRGRQAGPATGRPALFYGVEQLAGGADLAFGGTVKFQALQDQFPNQPRGYNLVYLVSSGTPPQAAALVREAKRRGARLVWNQNGVAFPAWHGPGWERVNEPMRELLALADHVFYQSEFCRASADRFLGPCRSPAEVLHNAVDTSAFTPHARPQRPLTLLTAGSHWQLYRLQCAIEALVKVRRALPDARLVIAGRFCWGSSPAHAEAEVRALVQAAGVAGGVEFRGPYAQREAPDVLRAGDILVHAKCNDPCPTLVLEAMACGLPVVYSASGGVPELVGSEAGIGVASDVNWDRYMPPPPNELAAAVLAIAGQLPAWSAGARARAVRQFDVARWRARHGEVFLHLMG